MKYFNETFINECRKAERKAQQQLFEQLYPSMFRVCMRYVNRDADAEDCLMRGFMKVFQNLEKFKYEGEHSLFAWIRKIMVNESLMFLRQRNNFILTVDEEVADVSFEAETIQRMDAEELYCLILKLPTGYRTVFNLNAVEGYDHKEIAKMLKISESTSRTQLAKAKNKLKVLVGQNAMNYERQQK
jgi:RNA polymerase sigma factor (sigma-70 family)